MHRCSSGNSQGNMVGPCTCGLFPSQTNSFSMLFSMPNHKPCDNEMDHHMYPYTSSSSSSVDCTLSLGTPSTRLSDNQMRHHERRPTASCMSNFCWDILQTSKNPPSPSPPPTHKNSRSGNTNSGGGGGGDRDPLLARRCANCDTTSTPLWRNGPRGPKSLCNACGIRFKKEERRASAASTTNGGGMMEAQQMSSHQNNNNNSWIHHSQAQRMPCLSPGMGNEFRFIEDDDRDSDAGGIPFLSWRLNVTDRPGLVHDFTR